VTPPLVGVAVEFVPPEAIAKALANVVVPLSVVVEVPVVLPIVIAVVEPARPPVPKLIVFVEAEAVAPAWMLVV